MIIFDYICSKCSIKEERYVKQDTQEKQLCWTCGNKMIRQSSFPGMIRSNHIDKVRVK